MAAREEPLNLKIEILLGRQITATLQQVKDKLKLVNFIMSAVWRFCFNIVNDRNVVS